MWMTGGGWARGGHDGYTVRVGGCERSRRLTTVHVGVRLAGWAGTQTHTMAGAGGGWKKGGSGREYIFTVGGLKYGSHRTGVCVTLQGTSHKGRFIMTTAIWCWCLPSLRRPSLLPTPCNPPPPLPPPLDKDATMCACKQLFSSCSLSIRPPLHMICMLSSLVANCSTL